MTDFAVSSHLRVSETGQLRDALLAHQHVRLTGSGSAQCHLPAPTEAVTVISTASMNRILRLEADDLTCSVEPGVTRVELDAALRAHRLCLPCGGTGTIGGIFAADREGPAAPAQPEPRSLLLGLSGVLSDGTVFKSGARVVKNVAGFDLQKLFVGSRGRLFAVTALHLKLRPAPLATVWFKNEGLGLADAIELTTALRRSQTPPQTLDLTGKDQSFAVTGCIDGDPRHIERWVGTFALTRCEPAAIVTTSAHPEPTDLETLQGQIPIARVPQLLAKLPAGTGFTLRGTRFTLRQTPPATDELLSHLAELAADAEIVGGRPERRGRRTPITAVITRLEAELKATLDPRGVLQ